MTYNQVVSDYFVLFCFVLLTIITIIRGVDGGVGVDGGGGGRGSKLKLYLLTIVDLRRLE